MCYHLTQQKQRLHTGLDPLVSQTLSLTALLTHAASTSPAWCAVPLTYQVSVFLLAVLSAREFLPRYVHKLSIQLHAGLCLNISLAGRPSLRSSQWTWVANAAQHVLSPDPSLFSLSSDILWIYISNCLLSTVPIESELHKDRDLACLLEARNGLDTWKGLNECFRW